MTIPQECSQKGDAGNTSPRGIRNDVSKVSCHVACAIQILCHAIPSVSSALQKLAVLPTTGPFPELLLFEELIDFVRVENNSNPWNPQRLYEYLQDAASIDNRNVGDATRSLTPSIATRIIVEETPGGLGLGGRNPADSGRKAGN